MVVSSHGNIYTHTFTDVECNSSVELDILSGAGTLFSVEVDNTNNDKDSFFKVWDQIAVTIGSAEPNLVLKIPPGEKLGFPLGSGGKGLAFAVGVSFACVTQGGKAGTKSPESTVRAILRTN